MRSDAVSQRLSTLQDSLKGTLFLLQRYSKLNLQPGSTPLDGSEADDVSVELSTQIHQNLKQQEEEYELIRQEVDDLNEIVSSAGRRRHTEREREAAKLAIQVVKLGEDLKQTNLSFRAVQLDVKRAAEAARRRERELLFSNLQAGDNSRVNASRRKGTERIGSADAIVTDASSDVVAALRRTHTLLASELARSRFAQETLEQSARALSDLSERYSRVDDLLGVSKALVGELFRSKKSDSWYLATALYILVGTLGWLIFRRLLWGPFWLLIWFPLKTVFNLLLWVAGGLVSTFKASVTDPSNTTTLKIQSSATGRSVPWPSNKGDRPFIRAGMGGTGAKTEEGKGAEPSTLEQIGRMTDQTRSEEETASASKETAPASSEQPKPPTAALRGDGKPLVESTEPRNPKKRMWEESNTSAERDEL